MNWKRRMTNLRRLKVCLGCAFIVCVLGFVQAQDEIDDATARQHDQRAPDWIDLEKVADAMTIIGRRK